MQVLQMNIHATRGRGPTFLVAGAVVVSVLALVCSAIATAQAPVTPAAQPPADRTAAFLQQYQAMPKMTVPVPRGNAAVLIVKFTDYECPACAATYRMYRPVLEKYEAQFPGAVKMVVKDFPLDKTCNPALMQTIHAAGCDAAIAVLMARDQNHGAEMEDWLYTNQQLLTPATVRRAADIIGGVADFNAGYQKAFEQVKSDAALGGLLKVDSTPTFFINGTKVAMVLQADLFDAAIAYELRKAGLLK
jgi:protein-disulfide isomerase